MITLRNGKLITIPAAYNFFVKSKFKRNLGLLIIILHTHADNNANKLIYVIKA